MATISALCGLSENVGASRIVSGIQIPHPMGNPGLAGDGDRKIRRELLLRAFEALSSAVEGPTIFKAEGVRS